MDKFIYAIILLCLVLAAASVQGGLRLFLVICAYLDLVLLMGGTRDDRYNPPPKPPKMKKETPNYIYEQIEE